MGLAQFLSVDPGIELGLAVFVTSKRYRQIRVGVRVGVRVRRTLRV